MPVQEEVLSHAFGGQDLYVQSQTGTGKTAAFLIVIFQRLLSEPLLAGKKAIIMTPTRELAVQIEEEAKKLAKFLPFKIGSFYGGVGYAQQTKMLRDNVQILVGTPGRVLDLNKSGQMNLMDIAFLIIDEADRMFDMGFYPDLRKLIKVVPPADRRQTMLFSATLNTWVKNLAWEYTKNPLEIEIAPEIVTVEEVEQLLYHVPSEDKMRLLLGILKREQPESAIIFCNTKKYTEIVARRLKMNGYEAEFIIGDLPQPKRLKVIEDIKAGKLKFLVATDVAARGLDIEGLSLVVNYDLPNEAENYVHRIVRTARAGKTGKAITLSSDQDVYELAPIERYIGQKLPAETATEELYGEDKSQGKRIHSDFYEDRGTKQGFAKHGSREEGRPKGRRESGTRDEGRNRRESGDRREGRSRRAEHVTEPRSNKGSSFEHKTPTPTQRGKKTRPGEHDNRKPAQHTKADPGVRLSELSLEERMAYYKQKYDNSEKSGVSSNAARPPRKQSHNRKQEKPQHAEEAAVTPPAPPVEPVPQNAEKKGFLSRVLGVFKKKEKHDNS
jgi:ATP-dependent RNA helicase RhlB